MSSLQLGARVTAGVSATFITRKVAFDLPQSDAHPVQVVSFRANPFVLNNGFPFQPLIWASTDTLVSTTGEYLSGEREGAFDVDIPAHTRFIASDSTWDPIAYRWAPATTRGINYFMFGGSSITAPVLDQVTYRVGKEVLTQQALVLNPGKFLTTSFNGGIDDALQYSVSFALLLETPGPYGIFSGPASQDKLELVTDGNQLTFSAQGRSATSNEKRPVTQIIPLYVCCTVSQDSVTLYTGTGPSSIRSSSIGTNIDRTSMAFTIGSDWAENLNATMYLMEFGLWDFAVTSLSDYSINELFSDYSSIYGVVNG